MDMALPMQAAPAHAAALADEWSDEEFRANLSKVFKRLIDFRETNADALADAMHIARSTLYGKLSTGKFSAAEVHAAARALGVKVDAFYQPADSLLSEAIVRCYMQAAGEGTHLDGQLELHFLPPPTLAVAPSLTIASVSS